MSLILDALKKSEAERQQNNKINIANTPKANNPQKISNAALIITFLLMLNAGILFFLFIKPSQIQKEINQTSEIIESPLISTSQAEDCMQGRNPPGIPEGIAGVQPTP